MAYTDLALRKRLVVLDLMHITTQTEAMARQARTVTAERDPAVRRALLVKFNADFGTYVRETRMSLARAVKSQDFVVRNTPNLKRD